MSLPSSTPISSFDTQLNFELKIALCVGGVISPVIANMALDGLEATVKQSAPSSAKVNVIRYADDVRITGATREVLEEYVVPTVEAFLEERGLNLSEAKTRIATLETGVDFLGVHLRKYDGKYRPEPAKESVRRLLRRCREFVRRHPAAKQEDLIRFLNPRIRGWANYFRHVCASKALVRVDFHIFQSVWRWAYRRHPNKRKTWVYDRYYRSQGKRKWIFSVRARNRQGRVYVLDLVHASSTGIRRHIKIRSQATCVQRQLLFPVIVNYFYRSSRSPSCGRRGDRRRPIFGR